MTEMHPIRPLSFPLDFLTCGFTTRIGGVSRFPFDSLNLGYATPDVHSSVGVNHALLYKFLRVKPADVAGMKQVHGDTIKVVDSGGIFPATDGLITSSPGILLTVKTADCIALLLYDTSKEVIGAVHCGWRSLVAGIAEKAVAKMKELKGTKPENIIAAIGPSAGPCCYEVGEDVASLLRSENVEERKGKFFADLRSDLKIRLITAGLKSSAIETINDCTICKSHLYYSHRRDGIHSGRMMGYIAMHSRK